MQTLTPRKLKNKINRELAEVERQKSQKPVKEIGIVIEWRKSRTWGYCPRATASVYYQDGTLERREGYYASGCGYDKESTVIAEIFNDFLKYKLYKPLKWKDRINGDDTNHPYGVSNHGDFERVPDERGYISKPWYDGGIGTNCYYNIAEFIGGKFESLASGKSFDAYKYVDGGK